MFPVEHDLRADLTVDSQWIGHFVLCTPMGCITLFLELTLSQFKPAVIYHKKEHITRAKINTWSTRFLPQSHPLLSIYVQLSEDRHQNTLSAFQMWLLTTQTYHPVSSLGLSSTLYLRRRTKSPWTTRIRTPFTMYCFAPYLQGL